MTIIFINIGTDIPKWYIPPETQSPHLLPPCTATMFNYNEHKRVGYQWYSVPFYSTTNGYKLQLEVHANVCGIDKDTHLSVGVRHMKGENDESLKWPLNSEITIQLLNWREDKGHVEMIINHHNLPIEYRTRVMDGETQLRSWVKLEVIPHKELHYNADKNTEYLHNDTLCFRVSKVTIHTGNKTYCILYNIIYMYTPLYDIITQLKLHHECTLKYKPSMKFIYKI